MAINLLKPAIPVIPIEMTNKGDLLRMMKTADNTHIYISAGVFHFNAFYAAADNFPAPRIYYMKTGDLMTVNTIGVYMQQYGVALSPMINEQFSTLIEDERYIERYTQWHKHWEENSKVFKRLLDGRVKNTAVTQGIWLSNNGSCMICRDTTDLMSTTTVIGEKGMMIGLQLCPQHEAEAKDHSTLFNYICEKMGVPAPFLINAKIVRHGQQTIDMTCDAVRKSGFRMIIRQDAINDYAYNIQ